MVSDAGRRDRRRRHAAAADADATSLHSTSLNPADTRRTPAAATTNTSAARPTPPPSLSLSLRFCKQNQQTEQKKKHKRQPREPTTIYCLSDELLAILRRAGIAGPDATCRERFGTTASRRLRALSIDLHPHPTPCASTDDALRRNHPRCLDTDTDITTLALA